MILALEPRGRQRPNRARIKAAAFLYRSFQGCQRNSSVCSVFGTGRGYQASGFRVPSCLWTRLWSAIHACMRLGLHVGAQDGVDAGLVTAAGLLEPLHDIMVNPDGQAVFGLRQG